MWARWRTSVVAHVRTLAEAEPGSAAYNPRSPWLPLLRAASAVVHYAATARAWAYAHRVLAVHRCALGPPFPSAEPQLALRVGWGVANLPMGWGSAACIVQMAAPLR
jgi:hypothetical protein